MDSGPLRLIKSLSWDEVFSMWRDSESNMPRWIEHYKNRGFDSWDAWRAHTIQDLDCRKLDWKLFEIENPEQVIPVFLGGPFRAWIARYYGSNETLPIKDIVKHEELQNSQIIQEMLAHFPKEVRLIALKTPKGIVLLEGMHRCCAFTLAVLEHKSIQSHFVIALAEYNGQLPFLGSEGSPT